MTSSLNLYKGFELHPLVFSRAFQPRDGHSPYAEGYDCAVRICRPNAKGGDANSRIFWLQQEHTFVEFGVARRAAHQRGRDIVDGKVDGASIDSL